MGNGEDTRFYTLLLSSLYLPSGTPGPLYAPNLPHTLCLLVFAFIYFLNRCLISFHCVPGSICSQRLVYFSKQKQIKALALVGFTFCWRMQKSKHKIRKLCNVLEGHGAVKEIEQSEGD